MLINTVLNKIRTLEWEKTGLTDGKSGTYNTNVLKKIASAGLTQKAHSIEADLESLAELVANTAEAFSAVIFLAHPEERLLTIGAYHSLSRDFIPYTKIAFGCGLVGWTAENKTPIIACPFENDSSTLLYYQTDQNLKSFISIPIVSRANNNVLGVLVCDSKKSYAFSKTAEKILHDCAKQAAVLIELHLLLDKIELNNTTNRDSLSSFLDELRKETNEDSFKDSVSPMSLEEIVSISF